MTPADLATANALSFECKKDSMRQNQSGEWRITFTVQAIDVPRRLTEAMPGARYQAVIVEIGENELPVQVPTADAKPDPVVQPRPDRVQRDTRDWRQISPAQQAGIRCNDPEFVAFLREERPDDWHESMEDPEECVRLICGVASRRELSENRGAMNVWQNLDEQFLTRKALERAS